METTTPNAGKAASPSNLFYRALKIFGDIRPGEGLTVLLLALNIFLIMTNYYIVKSIRDAWIVSFSKKGPYIKSLLGAAIAIVLIFVVKAFSRLASKVPRQILITEVTLFFIGSLAVFYVLNLLKVPLLAVFFFIWAGIASLLLPAQLWGFANDIYTEDVGKRVFPFIAFGAAFGSVWGSTITGWLIPFLGRFNMMLVGAGNLGISIGLIWIVHKREIRRLERKPSGTGPPGGTAKHITEQPLKTGGGFQLVFKSRYLLYIAVLIIFLNWVNTNGQWMLDNVFKGAAAEAIKAGTTGGVDEGNYLTMLYANFFRNVNWVVLLIQLFLVSRIFKRLGVRGAIFIFPFLSLGGYALASFGATLLVVQWVKTLENGTDYSLMNTIRGALYLITTREEKYKAKAAIDTVFVRVGDVLSAATVFLGSSYLAFKMENYAHLNVVCAAIWVLMAFLIVREHRKLSAAQAAFRDPRSGISF
jgi:AAA family ATP:ADP antiporter